MPSATRPCDLEKRPTVTWVTVSSRFTPTLTQVLSEAALARSSTLYSVSSGSSESSSNFIMSRVGLSLHHHDGLLGGREHALRHGANEKVGHRTAALRADHDHVELALVGASHDLLCHVARADLHVVA